MRIGHKIQREVPWGNAVGIPLREQNRKLRKVLGKQLT